MNITIETGDNQNKNKSLQVSNEGKENNIGALENYKIVHEIIRKRQYGKFRLPIF